MSARHGLFVAPFDELSDPRLLAGLAARAEERGWDGFFLWDHIVYDEPVREVSDPWIALAAIACATQRLAIGPLVTPLARRRVHKLARETVTLDRLSRGRLIFGAGLGGDRGGELSRFGEELDARARAQLLDNGLDKLTAYWDGALEPRARIPIWLAARWPNRKPVRRAARYDGLFPIQLPGPEALAELRAELPADRPFDLAAEGSPGTDWAPWIEAGATWCLTSFDKQPRRAEVEAAIEAGPT